MKNPWILLAIGLATGLLLFAVVRFTSYSDADIHYHANFAVYINGQREQFKDTSFYEEVLACSANESNNPRHRAHLHERVNDVVHVHAPGVSWGQFFENLGYSIGQHHLATRSHVYLAQDLRKVNFILNGEPVDNPANTVIKSEDKLLISFGTPSEKALSRQFANIKSSADRYNRTQDPAACAGSQPSGWRARLEHIFK